MKVLTAAKMYVNLGPKSTKIAEPSNSPTITFIYFSHLETIIKINCTR
jgi:hypothetical protein